MAVSEYAATNTYLDQLVLFESVVTTFLYCEGLTDAQVAPRRGVSKQAVSQEKGGVLKSWKAVVDV